MMAIKSTILVIEDRPDTLELLGAMMESAGYTALKAADGKKGLEMLRKGNVDLILLDLLLPSISGESLLRKIRRNRRYDKVKVIILTALRYSRAEQGRFLRMGAQMFLPKPVSVVELRDAVKKVLSVKYMSAQSEITED